MTQNEFHFAQETIQNHAERLLKNLNWHPELYSHALYALRGGKAVRPTLMFWIAKRWGHSTPSESLKTAALALEMIHAYSLIHDDLPCMDNDDFRRSRPTLHRLMGDAPALLLGDALLAGAFELLTYCDLESKQIIGLVGELSNAAGGAQLVGGQLDDLKFEKSSDTSLEMFNDIHRRKTGALFGAVATLTYHCLKPAHIDSSKIPFLKSWGVDLGIVFQYIDDLLDQSTLYKKLGQERLLENCRKLADDLCTRSVQFWDANESRALLEYFLKRQL